MFDLNVPLQEYEWGKDGNQLLEESTQPYALVHAELTAGDEITCGQCVLRQHRQHAAVHDCHWEDTR
jgi:hypothetical protein